MTILAASLVLGFLLPTPALASADKPCALTTSDENQADAAQAQALRFAINGNPNGATLLVLTRSEDTPLFAAARQLARDHLVVFPCQAAVPGTGIRMQSGTAHALMNLIKGSGMSNFILAFDADFSALAAHIARNSGPKLSGIINSQPAGDADLQNHLAKLVHTFWPDTDPDLYRTMHTVITAEDGRTQATVALHDPNTAGPDAFWSAQFLLGAETSTHATRAQASPGNLATALSADWAELTERNGLPLLIHRHPDQASDAATALKAPLFSMKAAGFMERLSRPKQKPYKIKTASN